MFSRLGKSLYKTVKNDISTIEEIATREVKMTKDNHVIVTKRRYSGLKALLIILAFAVEFTLFFMEDFQEKTGFVYALVAYMLLALVFIGNNNNKKTYLRYENILTLILKCMALNVLVTVIMFALLYAEVSPGRIIVDMLILTLINILSIVAVFCVVNGYMGKRYTEAKRILHIYPENFDRYDNQDVALKEIKKEIEGYQYVYLHNLSSRMRKRLLKFCYEHDKTVYCTANLSDVLLRASGLAQDIDTPVYYCTSFGIGGVSAMLKRIFDIAFSAVALLIALPVFAVVAVCIKLEDGGSVIYKQVRCTKNMKQFTIYKFRSMTENSEGEQAKLATSDDKRLTKVGHFIRRFKIDELPQLVNILKGDMSVVGPRPERPELIEEAIKNTPEFVLRTKVKAGLTGYAQVRGYYNTGFKDKLLWDLMYIENFSLLLDFKIIMMTVFTVFSENIRDE